MAAETEDDLIPRIAKSPQPTDLHLLNGKATPLLNLFKYMHHHKRWTSKFPYLMNYSLFLSKVAT